MATKLLHLNFINCELCLFFIILTFHAIASDDQAFIQNGDGIVVLEDGSFIAEESGVQDSSTELFEIYIEEDQSSITNSQSYAIPIRFDPPQLEIIDRPVGMPYTTQVIIINQSPHVSIQLYAIICSSSSSSASHESHGDGHVDGQANHKAAVADDKNSTNDHHKENFISYQTIFPRLQKISINTHHSNTVHSNGNSRQNSIPKDKGESITSPLDEDILIIDPGLNASFLVTFLAPEVGKIQETLILKTSVGDFEYNITANSIPNPYRIRGYYKGQLAYGASFDPIIHMFNPYYHAIQITEMWTSDPDFHLELPYGFGINSQRIWNLSPFQTKPVVISHFLARKFPILSANKNNMIHSNANERQTAYLAIKIEHLNEKERHSNPPSNAPSANKEFISAEDFLAQQKRGGVPDTVTLTVGPGPKILDLQTILTDPFLAHQSQNLLILTFELSVKQESGLYSPRDILDFGTLSTYDAPKMLEIRVFNNGPHPLYIKNISLNQANEAIQLEYKSAPYQIPVELKTSIVIGTITFLPIKATDKSMFNGHITIFTTKYDPSINNATAGDNGKEGSLFQLSIPYSVHFLRGALIYDHNNTRLNIPPGIPYITSHLSLTNTFENAIAIIDIYIEEDAKAIAKLDSKLNNNNIDNNGKLKSGFKVSKLPRNSDKITLLVIPAKHTYNKLSFEYRSEESIISQAFKRPEQRYRIAHLHIVSNVSRFRIPLTVYYGGLQLVTYEDPNLLAQAMVEGDPFVKNSLHYKLRQKQQINPNANLDSLNYKKDANSIQKPAIINLELLLPWLRDRQELKDYIDQTFSEGNNYETTQHKKPRLKSHISPIIKLESISTTWAIFSLYNHYAKPIELCARSPYGLFTVSQVHNQSLDTTPLNTVVGFNSLNVGNNLNATVNNGGKNEDSNRNFGSHPSQSNLTNDRPYPNNNITMRDLLLFKLNQGRDLLNTIEFKPLIQRMRQANNYFGKNHHQRNSDEKGFRPLRENLPHNVRNTNQGFQGVMKLSLAPFQVAQFLIELDAQIFLDKFIVSPNTDAVGNSADEQQHFFTSSENDGVNKQKNNRNNNNDLFITKQFDIVFECTTKTGDLDSNSLNSHKSKDDETKSIHDKITEERIKLTIHVTTRRGYLIISPKPPQFGLFSETISFSNNLPKNEIRYDKNGGTITPAETTYNLLNFSGLVSYPGKLTRHNVFIDNAYNVTLWITAINPYLPHEYMSNLFWFEVPSSLTDATIINSLSEEQNFKNAENKNKKSTSKFEALNAQKIGAEMEKGSQESNSNNNETNANDERKKIKTHPIKFEDTNKYMLKRLKIEPLSRNNFIGQIVVDPLKACEIDSSYCYMGINNVSSTEYKEWISVFDRPNEICRIDMAILQSRYKLWKQLVTQQKHRLNTAFRIDTTMREADLLFEVSDIELTWPSLLLSTTFSSNDNKNEKFATKSHKNATKTLKSDNLKSKGKNFNPIIEPAMIGKNTLYFPRTQIGRPNTAVIILRNPTYKPILGQIVPLTLTCSDSECNEWFEILAPEIFPTTKMHTNNDPTDDTTINNNSDSMARLQRKKLLIPYLLQSVGIGDDISLFTPPDTTTSNSGSFSNLDSSFSDSIDKENEIDFSNDSTNVVFETKQNSNINNGLMNNVFEVISLDSSILLNAPNIERRFTDARLEQYFSGDSRGPSNYFSGGNYNKKERKGLFSSPSSTTFSLFSWLYNSKSPGASEAHEEHINYHPSTLAFKLEPYREAKFLIKFNPKLMGHTYKTILLFRNNLTVLEALEIHGRGGQGKISLLDPISMNPLTFSEHFIVSQPQKRKYNLLSKLFQYSFGAFVKTTQTNQNILLNGHSTLSIPQLAFAFKPDHFKHCSSKPVWSNAAGKNKMHDPISIYYGLKRSFLIKNKGDLPLRIAKIGLTSEPAMVMSVQKLTKTHTFFFGWARHHLWIGLKSLFLRKSSPLNNKKHPNTIKAQQDLNEITLNHELQNECTLRGFRVSDCVSLTDSVLKSNQTRRIDVSFSPDFAVSRTQVFLFITTRDDIAMTNEEPDRNINSKKTVLPKSREEILQIGLLGTLPALMAKQCARRVSRPPWETGLFYCTLVSMIILLGLVTIVAYIEGVRIAHIQTFYFQNYINNANTSTVKSKINDNTQISHAQESLEQNPKIVSYSIIHTIIQTLNVLLNKFFVWSFGSPTATLQSAQTNNRMNFPTNKEESKQINNANNKNNLNKSSRRSKSRKNLGTHNAIVASNAKSINSNNTLDMPSPPEKGKNQVQETQTITPSLAKTVKNIEIDDIKPPNEEKNSVKEMNLKHRKPRRRVLSTNHDNVDTLSNDAAKEDKPILPETHHEVGKKSNVTLNNQHIPDDQTGKVSNYSDVQNENVLVEQDFYHKNNDINVKREKTMIKLNPNANVKKKKDLTTKNQITGWQKNVENQNVNNVKNSKSTQKKPDEISTTTFNITTSEKNVENKENALKNHKSSSTTNTYQRQYKSPTLASIIAKDTGKKKSNDNTVVNKKNMQKNASFSGPNHGNSDNIPAIMDDSERSLTPTNSDEIGDLLQRNRRRHNTLSMNDNRYNKNYHKNGGTRNSNNKTFANSSSTNTTTHSGILLQNFIDLHHSYSSSEKSSRSATPIWDDVLTNHHNQQHQLQHIKREQQTTRASPPIDLFAQLSEQTNAFHTQEFGPSVKNYLEQNMNTPGGMLTAVSNKNYQQNLKNIDDTMGFNNSLDIDGSSLYNVNDSHTLSQMAHKAHSELSALWENYNKSDFGCNSNNTSFTPGKDNYNEFTTKTVSFHYNNKKVQALFSPIKKYYGNSSNDANQLWSNVVSLSNLKDNMKPNHSRDLTNFYASEFSSDSSPFANLTDFAPSLESYNNGGGESSLMLSSEYSGLTDLMYQNNSNMGLNNNNNNNPLYSPNYGNSNYSGKQVPSYHKKAMSRSSSWDSIVNEVQKFQDFNNTLISNELKTSPIKPNANNFFPNSLLMAQTTKRDLFLGGINFPKNNLLGPQNAKTESDTSPNGIPVAATQNFYSLLKNYLSDPGFLTYLLSNPGDLSVLQSNLTSLMMNTSGHVPPFTANRKNGNDYAAKNYQGLETNLVSKQPTTQPYLDVKDDESMSAEIDENFANLMELENYLFNLSSAFGANNGPNKKMPQTTLPFNSDEELNRQYKKCQEWILNSSTSFVSKSNQ